MTTNRHPDDPFDSSSEIDIRIPYTPPPSGLNFFDRFCSIFAFVLGAVLIVLGIIGLFMGCRANFTLPPILGVLPAIVGWGIVRPIVIAWRRS